MPETGKIGTTLDARSAANGGTVFPNLVLLQTTQTPLSENTGNLPQPAFAPEFASENGEESFSSSQRGIDDTKRLRMIPAHEQGNDSPSRLRIHAGDGPQRRSGQEQKEDSGRSPEHFETLGQGQAHDAFRPQTSPSCPESPLALGRPQRPLSVPEWPQVEEVLRTVHASPLTDAPRSGQAKRGGSPEPPSAEELPEAPHAPREAAILPLVANLPSSVVAGARTGAADGFASEATGMATGGAQRRVPAKPGTTPPPVSTFPVQGLIAPSADSLHRGRRDFPPVRGSPAVLGGNAPRLVPVVHVAMVALRLHRAVRMMEDFPASACDDAWLRVHGALSSFRSEMLWLNENYHLAPPADGIEIDVSEALRKLRTKTKNKAHLPKNGRRLTIDSNSPYKSVAGVCHTELKGTVSDALW